MHLSFLCRGRLYPPFFFFFLLSVSLSSEPLSLSPIDGEKPRRMIDKGGEQQWRRRLLARETFERNPRP